MRFLASSVAVFLAGLLVGYLLAPAELSQQVWAQAAAEAKKDSDQLRNEAAIRRVTENLKAGATKSQTLELEAAAEAIPCMMVRGDVTRRDAGEKTLTYRGLWFVVGETVLEYPAPPPPPTVLPDQVKDLPAAELLELIRSQREENAQLRQRYGLLRDLNQVLESRAADYEKIIPHEKLKERLEKAKAKRDQEKLPAKQEK